MSDDLMGKILKEIPEWQEQNIDKAKCTWITLHHS